MYISKVYLMLYILSRAPFLYNTLPEANSHFTRKLRRKLSVNSCKCLITCPSKLFLDAILCFQFANYYITPLALRSNPTDEILCAYRESSLCWCRLLSGVHLYKHMQLGGAMIVMYRLEASGLAKSH